ncbi:hypothetical protein ISN45_Aa07g032040 [Arabidopsis thaliana x Arabidopsis arenosa]|uniref:Uncharacterized protein n=1 Tax=Arabidopsis thaliana x Arabidopsis arenosa TaxID=1240361 RepID=A0A8T1Y8G3_9BRAS|nr:hypothetical protein ISN45_Aa07g032040 [Arabidopsis thaliana x Arabidopsis arenosa]
MSGDPVDEVEFERQCGDEAHPRPALDTDDEWEAFNEEERSVSIRKYVKDKPPYLWMKQTFQSGEAFKDQLLRENPTMQWSMRLQVACSNLSAYTVLFDKFCLSCFCLVRESINYDRRTTGSVNPETVTYRFGTILVNANCSKPWILQKIQFSDIFSALISFKNSSR